MWALDLFFESIDSIKKGCFEYPIDMQPQPLAVTSSTEATSWKILMENPNEMEHRELRLDLEDGSLGGDCLFANQVAFCHVGDGWCWCTNLLHLILKEGNQVPFNYIIWDPNDPNHLRSGATRYSMVRYFGDSVLHDGQMMWDKNLCSKAKSCHGAAHAENMDSACLGWFKLILQMMLLLVMTILGCTIIHH